jgi:hypothetical protein
MLEDLIGAVAQRHGFRAYDYTAIWDGGQFDASLETHVLVIRANAGRQASARLTSAALADPWKPLRPIEVAFRQLARRARPRGS